MTNEAMTNWELGLRTLINHYVLEISHSPLELVIPLRTLPTGQLAQNCAYRQLTRRRELVIFATFARNLWLEASAVQMA